MNTFINHIPVAIYTCDHSGNVIAYNNALVQLLGFTPSTGKQLWCDPLTLYTPYGQLISFEATTVSNAIAQGKAVEGEQLFFKRADGSKAKVNIHVAPVFDQDSKFSEAVVTLIDVTGQSKGEEHEARLAAIVNTSDDTIISKTLDGMITSWNKSAERMFGYTEEEMTGRHISTIIPPLRIKEEEYIIGQIAKGNQVEHFETIRIAKNGTEIPLSISVSPVKNSNGEIIGASKIARDISSQKQSEEISKRYTDRLEIINLMVQTIAEELDLNKILQKVTDLTTRITGAQVGTFFYKSGHSNSNGEPHIVYTLSGTAGNAFEEFNMAEDAAIFNTLFSGKGVVRVDDVTKDPSYSQSIKHFNGREAYLPVASYLAVPVVSRSGQVIGGLLFVHPEAGKFTSEHEAIILPIAAQAAIGLDNAKLYEEVKALNEKKDEFIGLASHELKTPLTSITGYLQILNRINADEKVNRFVDKTLQQVRKLNILVSDLLDVSKIEAGKLQLLNEEFDARAILDDAIELVQQSYNTHHIILNTEVLHIIVTGDPNRIEQVIINLLTNAIKYSPMANQVEVVLSHTKHEITIGVKDQGIGIDPIKFPYLFSRFYRVEELNASISGLGIGLYISNEIVTRHKGKLWVESEPDKGSTFWFCLPL